MIEVVLAPDEVEIAVFCGARRVAGAILANRQHRYGNVDTDRWGVHIEGCAAELAVAKALYGRFWLPGFRPQGGSGDIGRMQVRSTQHDNGCLLIDKNGEPDPDDAAFILVTGRIPNLCIRGWLYAREGRRPEWIRETRGRSAYFVPQSALRAIHAAPVRQEAAF